MFIRNSTPVPLSIALITMWTPPGLGGVPPDWVESHRIGWSLKGLGGVPLDWVESYRIEWSLKGLGGVPPDGKDPCL